MIALDLCRAHFQVLLILYLKFKAKDVEGVKKEKKLNQYAILQGLKIINYITNVTYVKKDDRHPLVA